MPSEEQPDKFVRNFAIIAGIVTGIIVLALILPDLCRDRWEEKNTSMVHDKIKEADKLSGSDFMASYKIYEDVLFESSKHTITIDSLRQELDDAAVKKDMLYPRVQEKLNREEAEKNRLALQERQRQEQEQIRQRQAQIKQQQEQDRATQAARNVRSDFEQAVKKDIQEEEDRKSFGPYRYDAKTGNYNYTEP